MNKLQGRNLRVVLYEGPGADRLADPERFDVLCALLDDGFEVSCRGKHVETHEPNGSAQVMVGRFSGGDDVVDKAVPVCDLDGVETAEVPRLARQMVSQLETRAPGNWKPWFPVIDFDRCTHCMQCLSFCLFDVYGVQDKDKIVVRNQDNCKTDCPACSRVCPEAAIMFPKYTKGPINGDVVREKDLQSEAMKVDVSALLGGDIYASLRTRQSEARKRFSTERDESRALIERRKCLKKLQGALDIPDEVLMSLPSAGDIQERAARAKEKNKKRMARSQTVKDRQPAPTPDEWGI